MGDTPQADPGRRDPGASDETSKLELPSFRLPRLPRRRRRTEASPETGESAVGTGETDEVGADGAVQEPEPDPEPTQRLEPVPPGPSAAPAPPPAPAPEPVAQREPVGPAYLEVPHEPTEREEPAADGEAAPARQRFTVPVLGGRTAAAVTGLLVGVFGALLTYLSLQGCDVVRGTASCGGTGLLLLGVILVLMVLAGGALLALWGVRDARSTSFLAVGVLCVVVLLTLLEQVFSAWMFVVVPVLSAGCYVLSHWVTTAFIEPRPEKGPSIDVR